MPDQFNFKRVFSAACLGMLLFGVVIIILGSILPSLVTDFQLDGFEAGTLTSLLAIGVLSGSLFFGPIVDRYSYKYLLISCTLLVMIGVEALAFTHHIRILELSIMMIGAGGGAINGGTNALVADISDNSFRGKGSNLSLLGVFFGIGALGMPFVMGMLSDRFHYSSTLSVVGLLLIIPILFFQSTKFPQPKQVHAIPIKQSLGLLKDLNLILLGMVLFFQSGVEGIISNWTPLYLQTESNFFEDNALYTFSLFILSLTLTRVALISILNKIPSYKVLIFSLLIITMGILCFKFPVLPEREIIGLILLGSGVAAGFPVVLSYVGALFPHMSGTAFSIVLVIGISGNMLLNFLMGLITQKYGIEVFSTLVLVCTFFLAVTLLLTLKRIKDTIKI